MMQQPASVDLWDEITPQELPKRRRPGRKRKRRPQNPQLDESIRNERKIIYEENHGHEIDLDKVHETTELPRRRRKRPEMRNLHWDEELHENQRPLRRRGQRRKRPIVHPDLIVPDDQIPVVKLNDDDNRWIYQNQDQEPSRGEKNIFEDTEKDEFKQNMDVNESNNMNIKEELSISEFSGEINTSTYSQIGEQYKENNNETTQQVNCTFIFNKFKAKISDSHSIGYPSLKSVYNMYTKWVDKFLSSFLNTFITGETYRYAKNKCVFNYCNLIWGYLENNNRDIYILKSL